MSAITQEPLTARCDVLHAAYFPWIHGEVPDPAPERIGIVVPGYDGAKVSVLPPRRNALLACERATDMVVLGLDPGYAASRARENVGRPVEITAGFEANDPFLSQVGRSLRSVFRLRQPPSPQYLESLAAAIVEHLARCGTPPAAASTGGLAPHRLERLKALIAERYAEELLVEDLAAAVSLSPFHFARMFKQATGQSPHAYLTRVRMEAACALLRETQLPLAQVAAKVGFRTQAHFTGVFHKHVGTTPRAYRRQPTGR